MHVPSPAAPQRIGEKDPEGAARAAVQSLAVGLAGALVIGGTAAIVAPALLRVMGASEDVIRTGSGFARVMLGMSGTVLLLFLINSIFRGSGDAAIAMRVLWFANAINITLGPCLVLAFGPFPRLGVQGAAIATSIGRGSGVLLQLSHLTRGGHRVAVRMRHLRPDPRVMAGILRLSLVTGDSIGLGIGVPTRLGADRRVRRGQCLVFGAGHCQRDDIQERPVENQARIGGSVGASSSVALASLMHKEPA